MPHKGIVVPKQKMEPFLDVVNPDTVMRVVGTGMLAVAACKGN